MTVYFCFQQKEIKLLQSSQADSKHGPYPHNKDESFAKEGMEYEDPEFFHMTVTKLKKELNEVHSECQYWKDAAKSQVKIISSLPQCSVRIAACHFAT